MKPHIAATVAELTVQRDGLNDLINRLTDYGRETADVSFVTTAVPAPVAVERVHSVEPTARRVVRDRALRRAQPTLKPRALATKGSARRSEFPDALRAIVLEWNREFSSMELFTEFQRRNPGSPKTATNCAVWLLGAMDRGYFTSTGKGKDRRYRATKHLATSTHATASGIESSYQTFKKQNGLDRENPPEA